VIFHVYDIHDVLFHVYDIQHVLFHVYDIQDVLYNNVLLLTTPRKYIIVVVV